MRNKRAKKKPKNSHGLLNRNGHRLSVQGGKVTEYWVVKVTKHKFKLKLKNNKSQL